MAETITTYKLKDPETALPMDRAEFYLKQVEHFQNKRKPDLAVGIVNIFIFDEKGEIFVQKRSDKKAHNAGMLDKSIGGHITFGDAADFTVMVETVQELQVPSITLRTQEDFLKAYVLLKDYLNTVAVLKHIDTRVYELKKKIKGNLIPIFNNVHLYFGIYSGSVKTVDREAKGVLLYLLEDLEREIEEFPGMFTDDLKFFVKRYRPQIVEFIKATKTKQ